MNVFFSLIARCTTSLRDCRGSAFGFARVSVCLDAFRMVLGADDARLWFELLRLETVLVFDVVLLPVLLICKFGVVDGLFELVFDL